MKKNKVLYYICKGLNWIHWFIILLICAALSMLSEDDSYDLEGYGMIIFISTFLYVIFWYLFHYERSRILYQMWYFLGYIYADYYLLFSPTGGLASWFDISAMHASVIQKIVLTFASICAIAHKLYTMIYEKDDYKAINHESGTERQYHKRKEPSRNIRENSPQVSRSSAGLTKEQQQAIYQINRKYKEGCTAIVKANGDNGAWANSDKTNREIAQLRKRLEQEAEQRGVKGKVSIY